MPSPQSARSQAEHPDEHHAPQSDAAEHPARPTAQVPLQYLPMPNQPVSYPPFPAHAAPPLRRRGTRALWIGLAAAVVFMAVAAGVAAWAVLAPADVRQLAGGPSPFEAARSRCTPGSAYVVIGDEGRSMEVQSIGEEQAGISFAQLQCLWTALDVPDAVVAEITSTRALDGRQAADWDGRRASWSYHPDSGLHMVFTLT